MDTVDDMVEALKEREGRLNQWEREFLASVRKRIARRKALTETQLDKLVEVYYERVRGIEPRRQKRWW